MIVFLKIAEVKKIGHNKKMRKFIIANWKMNPNSPEAAEKLARETDISGLIIAPPFPFLEIVGRNLKNAELGAQDLFWENQGGAYTGEVSVEELKSLGVKYVIIGHSERRRNLGETDEMVAKKMKTALKASLTPILCVGESADERALGKTEEVVEKELKIGLSLIGNRKSEIGNLIVAYEPIWAIGTGHPDTPQNMLNMVKYINKTIEKISPELAEGIHIIYGGSVTSKNAEDFLKHKEISGVLVGGASLKSEEITKIVEIGKAST